MSRTQQTAFPADADCHSHKAVRSSSAAGSAAVSLPVCPQGAVIAARPADFLELTKPRIAVLVLVTVTVGFALGSSQAGWDWGLLLDTLFGVALVAAASSAFNQVLERDTDARMHRTADRPLPAGRLQPADAILFGTITAILGVLHLALQVNPLTALLALFTLVMYAGVYTPLKRRTSLCTTIGAIPGALPPVLGWTAVRGSLGIEALVLFGIMFLWQFPHFLAIIWRYRQEYQNAGLRMLPSAGKSQLAGWLAATYSLALIPVSLLPGEIALAGRGYSLAAMILGAGYAVFAILFLVKQSPATARRLIFASLLYLPLLLAALTWDHFALLQL